MKTSQGCSVPGTRQAGVTMTAWLLGKNIFPSVTWPLGQISKDNTEDYILSVFCLCTFQ